MKVELNCDSANKMVKSLTADRNSILRKESDAATFTSTAAACEADRPEYSFSTTQAELDSLAERIFALKHAVNVFNATTVLPMGYTIDEALVRMKFLSDRKSKLEGMRVTPEKQRSYSRGLGDPEYTFRNYDAKDVEAAYRKVSDELTALQQALNIANLTKTFEVDLP